MGIPRFYRWLSERYPQINQRLDENVEQLLPQFDNMYLDANGIIHNCSHPNDDLQVSAVQLSLEEMATQMCAYIDRMVQLIRPEKVLFIAIDGCAPRAKMNQQRCRRFATARDAALAHKDLPQEEIDALFDSNQITPGTQFMADLSHFFEFFFRLKIKSDPLYTKLKVIFSGNNVAGEGEHKIMDYIRNACTEETRHCLVGLDADLICLALASHMPHFSLLREAVNFQAFRSAQKQNATKEVQKQITQAKFELLRISTLRDYIALEYSKATKDRHRVFDDWVLMIMLVGNDFLPPLPTLDIFEGGLDSMLEMHKDLVQTTGKFLVQVNSQTGKKEICFPQLELLFKRLGAQEERVFAEREVRLAKERGRRGRESHLPHSNVSLLEAEVEEELDSEELSTSPEIIDEAEQLRLGETKRRRQKYYAQKFGACDDTLVTEVVARYVQGLNWVFQYYYFGVPSWNWFFPFHYAPLCSDLTSLAGEKQQEFDMGQPFPPFCQLLACLPANSSKFLPRPFQDLMVKPYSPLKDFYPSSWVVDENGKRNPWEFVNLLPFIDEHMLFEAVSKLDLSELTPQELARNQFGEAVVYESDLTNLNEIVHSPFRNHYSQTLAPAMSSKKTFTLRWRNATPTVTAGEQTKSLLSDSSLAAHPRLVPQQCVLKPIKLNTFGSPSQKSTLVLKFSPCDYTLETLAQRTDNRVCYVNYPHLNEAIVVQVVDVKQRRGYCFETNQWIPRVDNADEMKQELELINSQSKFGGKLPGTGGLEFEPLSYLALRVKTLCEVREDPATGLFEKKYSSDAFTVPVEMVVFDLEDDGSDYRFKQQTTNVLLEDRFPLGVEVVCVGERGYGMLGSVVGYQEQEQKVRVEFPKLTRPNNEFARSLATSLQDKYFTLTEVAKRVNLPIPIVDKFLGSLKVWNVLGKQSGKPQAVDFGLNLRVGKGFVVPGFARFLGGGGSGEAWKSGDSVVRVASSQQSSAGLADTRNAQGNLFEYSQSAVDLLQLYQQKFPHLFQRVAQAKTNSGDFQRKDLFVQQDNTPELILTWLRQLASYSIPLVPVSSTQMSRTAVDAIDLATAELKQSKLAAAGGGGGKVVVEILPHLLRKNPQFNRGQMLSPTSLITPPLLGDRVLNLTNVLIPFGLRGYVVATHPTSGAVQVMFEDPFVGGTTMSGLCKAGKGALLPYIQVLNLTQRGVISEDPKAPLPTNKRLPPTREELRELQLKALEARSKNNPTPHAKTTPAKKPAVQQKPTTTTTPNLAWNAPPATAKPRPGPAAAAKKSLSPAPVAAVKKSPNPAATAVKKSPNPAATAVKKSPNPAATAVKKSPSPAVAVAQTFTKPPVSSVAPAANSSSEDPDDLANYFLNLMNSSTSTPPPPQQQPAPAAKEPAPPSSSSASLARVEALFKRAQQQQHQHDTD